MNEGLEAIRKDFAEVLHLHPVQVKQMVGESWLSLIRTNAQAVSARRAWALGRIKLLRRAAAEGSFRLWRGPEDGTCMTVDYSARIPRGLLAVIEKARKGIDNADAQDLDQQELTTALRFVAFELIADEFQSSNLTYRHQHALSHINEEEPCVSACTFALLVPKPEGFVLPTETVSWDWPRFQALPREHQEALSCVTMAALWDVGAASSVRLLPDWGLSNGSGTPAERRLRIAVTPSGFRGRLMPDCEPQPDRLSDARLSLRVAQAMLEVVRHAVTIAEAQLRGGSASSAPSPQTVSGGAAQPSESLTAESPSSSFSNSARPNLDPESTILSGDAPPQSAATPPHDNREAPPALGRMHWEILQFLSKNAPGKFTRFDIAKSLGHNKDTVGSRVKDLANWGLVRAEPTAVVLLNAGEDAWQAERLRRNPPAGNSDNPAADSDVPPEGPELTGTKPE